MSATEVLTPASDAFVMTGPIQCRRCHATVTWARSRKGSAILMDFRPVPLGEYCIVGIDHPYRIVAKLANPPAQALRYMCHFDTCPYRRARRNPNRYRRTLSEADASFKREWDERARKAA
jgi:hypothetical protein